MKLRRFVPASLLLVTFFTASRLVAAQGDTAIDAILRAAVERKDVPGVVALVTNRDRVVYQGAFGVADVSTGRALTMLALLQLVEQGKLSLDDSADKYLPELAGLKVFESFDPATGEYKLRPATRRPTVRQRSEEHTS